MNLVTAELYLAEFLVGYFYSRLILIHVQDCLDFEPGARLGAANQIDDGLIMINGCPLQFKLINENSRCSILFHLLVPGG
jgi:hypothetical protein